MRGRGPLEGEQRKQIQHALQASLWRPQRGQGPRAGRQTPVRVRRAQILDLF